jgi:hypothetical protein
MMITEGGFYLLVPISPERDPDQNKCLHEGAPNDACPQSLQPQDTISDSQKQ